MGMVGLGEQLGHEEWDTRLPRGGQKELVRQPLRGAADQAVAWCLPAR